MSATASTGSPTLRRSLAASRSISQENAGSSKDMADHTVSLSAPNSLLPRHVALWRFAYQNTLPFVPFPSSFPPRLTLLASLILHASLENILINLFAYELFFAG